MIDSEDIDGGPFWKGDVVDKWVSFSAAAIVVMRPTCRCFDGDDDEHDEVLSVLLVWSFVILVVRDNLLKVGQSNVVQTTTGRLSSRAIDGKGWLL